MANSKIYPIAPNAADTLPNATQMLNERPRNNNQTPAKYRRLERETRRPYMLSGLSGRLSGSPLTHSSPRSMKMVPSSATSLCVMP